MASEYSIPGVITVEPEVLETIARLTAMQVPGIVAIAERDVDRFLGKVGSAVSVQVIEGRVAVDLHVIAGPDTSLLKLGRAVQTQVTQAIQTLIGMPVEAVNVYIEDVHYPQSEARVEPTSERSAGSKA